MERELRARYLQSIGDGGERPHVPFGRKTSRGEQMIASFPYIALVALGILLRFKLNSVWLILAGAVLGLLRFWVLGG